jgi:hypothetical protein
LALLNGRRPRIYYDDDYAGYLGAAKLLLRAVNGSAFVPGIDFDLLDTRQDFERSLKGHHHTNDINELATLSGDPKAFLTALKPRA